MAFRGPITPGMGCARTQGQRGEPQPPRESRTCWGLQLSSASDTHGPSTPTPGPELPPLLTAWRNRPHPHMRRCASEEPRKSSQSPVVAHSSQADWQRAQTKPCGSLPNARGPPPRAARGGGHPRHSPASASPALVGYQHAWRRGVLNPSLPRTAPICSHYPVAPRVTHNLHNTGTATLAPLEGMLATLPRVGRFHKGAPAEPQAAQDKGPLPAQRHAAPASSTTKWQGYRELAAAWRRSQGRAHGAGRAEGTPVVGPWGSERGLTVVSGTCSEQGANHQLHMLSHSQC